LRNGTLIPKERPSVGAVLASCKYFIIVAIQDAVHFLDINPELKINPVHARLLREEEFSSAFIFST
jgi:hypothetical protein